MNRGAVRVCRREPKKSSSVATATLPAAEDEPVRERRLDRLDVERRADELPHALQRTVARATSTISR